MPRDWQPPTVRTVNRAIDPMRARPTVPAPGPSFATASLRDSRMKLAAATSSPAVLMGSQRISSPSIVPRARARPRRRRSCYWCF